MIVRTLAQLEGTDLDVEGGTWRSRRLITAADGQRFSLHDTIVNAGTTTEMCYRNHVEAVYCIEGQGTLLDHRTGDVHELAPGTMYLLDEHDRHTVRAQSQLRMVCVFDPPLQGGEVHDETGAFPASSSADPADRGGRVG